MIRIAALLLWLYLLTPAMNIGKAWQSHAEPGHTVTVNFKSGPVDGHMIYMLDGSPWLRDKQGAEHRLDGSEIISGQAESHQGRSTLEILGSNWRRIAPLVLITAMLLGIQFFQFRRES